MSITEKQRDKRVNHIGASDAPVIMGCSPVKADGTPYRTRWDVYAEKTGKLPARVSTAAMDAGNAFERGIIALSINAGIIGAVKHNQYRILRGTNIASNLDAIEIKTAQPVEAKLRRNDGQGQPVEFQWGEPNTDNVPRDVIIQATVQMLCTGANVCKIVAVLASRGWNIQSYYVEYNKTVGDWIVEGCEDFWKKYIETDTPPPDSLPSEDTVRFMRRKPKSTIVIPNGIELVRAKENADSVYAAAKSVKEAADLALKGALGSCEEGTFPEGWITYFPVHYKKYTVPASDRRRIVVNLNSGK